METAGSTGAKDKLVDANPDALRDGATLAHHLKKLVKESLRTAAKVAEEEKHAPQLQRQETKQ